MDTFEQKPFTQKILIPAMAAALTLGGNSAWAANDTTADDATSTIGGASDFNIVSGSGHALGANADVFNNTVSGTGNTVDNGSNRQ